MTGSAELSKELLARPAPHAVRQIAAARLAEVSATFQRLRASDDEDLHDLRVALRRLRSWLRAYRPELADTVRKKTRRRLSEVADATSGARDVEVALEWIGAADDLTPRQRAGARYMTERLQREMDDVKGAVRKTLDGDLPRLLDTLSGQLGTYWLRQTLESPEPPTDMATVTRAALLRHAERFGRALERIKSPGDVEAAHRARIAAKRLRYLLESLGGDPDAKALVAKLAALQGALGVVHDGHRVANRLVKEVGECAARDVRRLALESLDLDGKDDDTPPFAKIRPGLTALAKRCHQRERTAFQAFRRRWRKRQIRSTIAGVTALADSL